MASRFPFAFPQRPQGARTSNTNVPHPPTSQTGSQQSLDTDSVDFVPLSQDPDEAFRDFARSLFNFPTIAPPLPSHVPSPPIGQSSTFHPPVTPQRQPTAPATSAFEPVSPSSPLVRPTRPLIVRPRPIQFPSPSFQVHERTAPTNACPPSRPRVVSSSHPSSPLPNNSTNSNGDPSTLPNTSTSEDQSPSPASNNFPNPSSANVVPTASTPPNRRPRANPSTSAPPDTSNDENATQSRAAPRFNWDFRATCCLIKCKRAYDDARLQGGLQMKVKTRTEQWEDVARMCVEKGLVVSWEQAWLKWTRLWPAYQQIADWERRIPSGKKSYWMMTSEERKKENFRYSAFERQLFELMEREFGRERAVDPTADVIDSCDPPDEVPVPSEPLRPIDRNTAGPTLNTAATGVPKRGRKRVQEVDVGLKAATSDIMRGMELAEQGRDRRMEMVEQGRDRRQQESLKTSLEVANVLGSSIVEVARSLDRFAERF